MCVCEIQTGERRGEANKRNEPKCILIYSVDRSTTNTTSKKLPHLAPTNDQISYLCLRSSWVQVPKWRFLKWLLACIASTSTSTVLVLVVLRLVLNRLFCSKSFERCSWRWFAWFCMRFGEARRVNQFSLKHLQGRPHDQSCTWASLANIVEQ
jgi:hypothetical protein